MAGETVKEPLDSTSYGHNMELIWLLDRAAQALGADKAEFDGVARMLGEHCLRFGFDHERGGVYRDGPHGAPAVVRDKEWWQNCESLVGFLELFGRFGDERYFEAFVKIWDFSKTHFISEEFGEWRQLLTREGEVISGVFGNAWKAFYHSGRAIMESRNRLQKLIGQKN